MNRYKVQLGKKKAKFALKESMPESRSPGKKKKVEF